MKNRNYSKKRNNNKAPESKALESKAPESKALESKMLYCNDFKDSRESNLDFNNYFEFANFIFGQIKLQQEVRDRWFGHYLGIFGGVIALSTFAINFFQATIAIEKLLLVSSSVFMLTGLLGLMFYFLFLFQRLNYRRHYSVLYEIQNTLISKFLIHSYEFYYPKYRPFKTNRFGADFFSVLIQNIIISTCISVGIAFFLRSNGCRLIIILLFAFISELASVLLLYYIFLIFEKQK